VFIHLVDHGDSLVFINIAVIVGKSEKHVSINSEIVQHLQLLWLVDLEPSQRSGTQWSSLGEIGETYLRHVKIFL